MEQKKSKFNPVKEETGDARAKRVIWSTTSLDQAVNALGVGKKLKANPFYENEVKLLKADLVYERTEDEIKEWQKCRNDIIYFADKYCKLMTPEGIKNIHLRDYQKDYLEHLMKHRLSIFLSCRQSGKCFSFLTKVHVIINERKYNLPVFELLNLFDKSFKWKLKFPLYKTLYKLKNKQSWFANFINKTIGLIDRFENDDTKLIRSYKLNNIKILTDTGYSQASHIHVTKKFSVYKLKVENGYELYCADNHIVFDKDMEEVFVKDLKPGMDILTDNGPVSVLSVEQLPYKQCMCDVTVDDNNHRFYSNNILSHNTTTSAIFMLHYLLFNVDKNSLVLGNKRRTAVEILDKLKSIFRELPFFLRPGVNKWNESEIVLDNGCRCMAEATTINSGISFTFHCVLCDEFAHIAPNIIDKFYNNIFPTIVAGRARLMITSTQNGYNLFYRLYKAAEAGESEYSPFKVDWWQVPEWNAEEHCWKMRDENWHRLQVANLGGEENFNKQFGTSFDIGANTLISQKKLKQYQQEGLIEFEEKSMPGVAYSNAWLWQPNVDIYKLKEEPLIITVDLGEGVGQDYTCFSVFRLLEGDTAECIGMFRSNSLNHEKCAESLVTFQLTYCAPYKHLVSIERNTYGDIFLNDLLKLQETSYINWDRNSLVKYYNETGTKWSNAIKITSGNKSMACSLFKEDFERKKLINKSTLFANELLNFCDDGSGHYRASYGHDDIVMTNVQLQFVKQTRQYKFLKENIGVQTNRQMFNPYSALGSRGLSYDTYMRDYISQYQQQNVYSVQTQQNKSRLK